MNSAEDFTTASKEAAYKASQTSSKHKRQKHDKNKERKSKKRKKEKRERSDKQDLVIEESKITKEENRLISAEDYFLLSQEFRVWLLQCKKM